MKIKSMFGSKMPDFSAMGKSFMDQMSKGTGTNMVTTGGGSGTALASPLLSMKEVFLEIRDNTKETVELLKTAVMGTAEQNKKDSITAGDVDSSKPKGPGILSKVGSAFGSLLPEKGGFMDTLLKLGLAVGGIALLNIFGDKLTGPLGGLIKAFKEGKIGEKIGEIVTDIQEYLTPLWVNIKEKVGEFIGGVRVVFGLIEGAYKGINDYIMSFDTKGKIVKDGPLKGLVMGDGKLDDEEKQNMVSDVTTKLSAAIFGFMDGFVANIIAAFTLYSVSKLAIGVLMKRALPLAVAGGALSLGGALTLAAGVAAIGVVIAAGAWKLADNVATAYEDATTDALGQPQDFAPKEFITRLLVGKKTGNKITDVLQNAYDKMFIGAATGAAIGGVAGAGVFSIPAAGFGAVIGALSGITIGALSAYYGDEAVDKVIDDMVGEESPLGMVASYITDMYKRLILTPFEFIFGKLGTEGDSLFSKMQMKLGNPSGSNERKIYNDEELYGENVNPDKVSSLSDDELVNIKKNNVSELANLDKTKSIFGFHPFGEYMDNHSSRKVLMTLDVVNAEIQKRGLINAPNFLQVGKLDNPNNIEMMPRISTLKEEVERRELGRQLNNMIVAPTIDKSIKSSSQTINYGGLDFLHHNKTAETVKYSQVREQ